MKFAQSILREGNATINICNALKKYFSAYSIPQNLILERGTGFYFPTVTDMLKLCKIDVHSTTP